MTCPRWPVHENGSSISRSDYSLHSSPKTTIEIKCKDAAWPSGFGRWCWRPEVPSLDFLLYLSLLIKVAEHSFRARFCWCNSARANGLQNKHAVNRAVLFLLKHPRYLRYFSLLLNAVYWLKSNGELGIGSWKLCSATLSGQPLLSGHSLFPRGRPFHRASTVFGSFVSVACPSTS